MPAPRSPRYPLIDLAEAVELVRKIWKAESRNTMSPEVAARHLGYKGLNGASLRVISALRKYRLLDGRGDDVRISDDAITILADEETRSPERVEALKRSAFADTLFSELRQKFQGSPSEANLRSYLMKNGFNEEAAAIATSVYLSTLRFVENESNAYTAPASRFEAPKVKVGDYVQWESNGQLQFLTPRRVRELVGNGSYAMVEGSDTGIPVSELTVQAIADPSPGFKTPPMPPAAGTEIGVIRVSKDCAIRLIADGPYSKRSIEALVKNLQLQLELGTYDDEQSLAS